MKIEISKKVLEEQRKVMEERKKLRDLESLNDQNELQQSMIDKYFYNEKRKEKIQKSEIKEPMKPEIKQESEKKVNIEKQKSLNKMEVLRRLKEQKRKDFEKRQLDLKKQREETVLKNKLDNEYLEKQKTLENEMKTKYEKFFNDKETQLKNEFILKEKELNKQNEILLKEKLEKLEKDYQEKKKEFFANKKSFDDKQTQTTPNIQEKSTQVEIKKEVQIKPMQIPKISKTPNVTNLKKNINKIEFRGKFDKDICINFYDDKNISLQLQFKLSKYMVMNHCKEGNWGIEQIHKGKEFYLLPNSTFKFSVEINNFCFEIKFGKKKHIFKHRIPKSVKYIKSNVDYDILS